MIVLHNTPIPVSHLFHISDIHIRLFQRQNEYNHVFHQLYDYIIQFPKGNHLIIITGDILHSKNELSPECCQLTLDFLQSLSEIYPTLFILGNHDCLLNNLDRIDSLSSILYERHIPNLYFLRNTDVYRYDNIAFYVDSLIDTLSPFSENVPDDVTKIGLYHGQIEGWKNASHYVSTVGERTVNDFPMMDFVLLGDIHKHQFMTPTMAYSGSLISQNFGEFDEQHGVLVWNLLDKTTHFQTIENPYRHVQLCVRTPTSFIFDNCEYSTSEIPLPCFGKVKVYSSLSNMKNKESITNLKSSFPHCHFHLHASTPDTTPTVAPENLFHNEQEIVAQYIQSQNIPKEDKEHILKLISTQWIETSLQQNFTWELKKISFSHMFGYGADNIIELPTSHSSIIGIFGENSCGKSTIIEIITVLLFGKITRFVHGATTPKEIINFSSQKASGSIEFTLGNEQFRIEKTFTRNKNNKIKVVEKFFRIHQGNQIELTDEQRKKTDKFIEEIIGKYDIFAYTNLFLQQKEKSFRDYTPMEKKKFLFDLFGYVFFENFEKSIKEKLKHYKTLEQAHLEKLNGHSHATFQEKQNNYQNQIETFQKNMNTEQEKHDNLGSQLKTLYCQLKTPVDKLQKNQNDHSPQQFHRQQKQRQDQIRLLEEKQRQISTILETIESSNFLARHDQFQEHDLYRKYSPFFKENVLSSWQSFLHKITVKDTIMNLQQQCNEYTKSIEKLPEIFVDPDNTYSFSEYKKETKQKHYTVASIQKYLLSLQKKVEQEKQSVPVLPEPSEDDLLDAQSLFAKVSNTQKSLSNVTKLLADFDNLEINPNCTACQKNPHVRQKKSYEADHQKLKTESTSLTNSLSQIFEKFSLSSTISPELNLLSLQNFRKKFRDRQREEQEQQKLHFQTMKLKNTIALLQNQDSKATKMELLQKRECIESQLEKVVFFTENKTIIDLLQEQWNDFSTKDNRNLFFNLHQHKATSQSVQEEIAQLKMSQLEEQKIFDSMNKIWEQDCEIYKKICSLESQKTQSNTILHQLVKDSQKIMTASELLAQQYSLWKNDYAALQEITNQKKLHYNILKIIEKDGLPLHLLKQKISLIEENINLFCQPFLSRRIQCRVVQNTIEFGCETPLADTLCNYVGGMESFIIDIACKLTFAKLSMVPKSNFFIIDEGISVLDKQHLHNIDQFFAFLSSITQNVLLISHIPQIKDYVHTAFTVEKKGLYSRVRS
jgi:DNA repair exonuclease SbcCD ATPase subunit